MGGSPLSILVTGMAAADPGHGGAAWAVMQYVLGFRQLGHHVCFIEPVTKSKLRPQDSTLAKSETARRFRRLMAGFGLSSCSALLLEDTTETVGLSYESLQGAAQCADVIINISGMLTDPGLLAPIDRRVYLDLDPGFNQAWHSGGIDMHLDAHTHFATVGLSIGRPECRIPTCGKRWLATCPPVVLRQWPFADRITRHAFTTVANWRSYGALHHDGMFLGQKVHSLRPLIGLPRKTKSRFTLALSIHPSEPDLDALHLNGWRLIDPHRAAGTPSEYRRFVGGSRAEFGIAKSGYVVARSGWFSDRSACYLASGRPVLAHDTGFRTALPTGEGLIAFATEEEVLVGIEAIEADYQRHRQAARAVAETHFDSDRVLTRLLDCVGATS